MKNFLKINKLKLADKLKFKDQKGEKYVSSIPIQITNNDFQISQNENTLYPISRCLMDIKLPNNIFEQNKLILFQRTLLLLGEIVFSGTYVSRRKEAQKTFHVILKDVNIEKLNKMSRKQKFISYTRIKIGLTILIYEKNIRILLEEGKCDDVYIILKESRKI